MPSSLLFSINNEGRVFGLSTNGTKWREFVYLGLEFKQLSAVPHYLWAVGGDCQVYVHVHGLDVPIRIKEEAYENERWTPFDGFSKRLLPTDRFQFSNQDGTKDRTLKKIRLPSMAWQWEGDWHLELTLEGQPLDHDGWTYALDFPATYYPEKTWKSYVRRRKWIRYRRYSALNSWCAIAPLHKDPTREPFICVSVGGHEIPGADPGLMLVWAVTAHGRVMFRTGVSHISPEGQRWTSIPVPSGCEVCQLSVGPTGLVWAVLCNGKALVRAGVHRTCLSGESWVEVKPPEENKKLIQLSIGRDSLWAVTNNHAVWFRKGIKGENIGISEELAKGLGWVQMCGNMASVSVASNNQVWAVGHEDRCLYFRTGVTSDDLTGKTWKVVGAPTQLSRTSSVASLFSGGLPPSGTPREKRHRSWTSLNRHSGSHEPHLHLELDLEEETSHSAPVTTRTIWQKSADGGNTSMSYQSRYSSDSSGVASSLQDNLTFQNNSDRKSSSNDSLGGSMQSDDTLTVHEVKAREVGEDSSNKFEGNEKYEDFSHPVVSCVGKEHKVKKSTRSWSPMRSCGSIVGVEANSEADSSIFESDHLLGVYGEVGEREEEDDHLYWADSEGVWCCVEAGACHVEPSHLPNWFVENTNTSKLHLSNPWRTKILTDLKSRLPVDLDLSQYEKAVNATSWVKTGEAKCLMPDETSYQECVLELEWVCGEDNDIDCGTLTISTPDKSQTKDQINMTEATCITCCSEPSTPRLAIYKCVVEFKAQVIKLQFASEEDLEDWISDLSSVCCHVLGIRGKPSPDSLWATNAYGDIFVFDPSYLTTEQYNQDSNNYLVNYLVSGKQSPIEVPLMNGFKTSDKISVIGCVHDNASRFSIDLLTGQDSQNVALHLNPRFQEQTIVFNTKNNGQWGNEERTSNTPFKQGSEFIVEIICNKECYDVFIDGQKFYEYKFRNKTDGGDVLYYCVTGVRLNGDASFMKVSYVSGSVVVHPCSVFWRQIGGHLRKVESAGGVTWGISFDNTAWFYTGGCGGSYLKSGESTNVHPMSDGHCYYVYENQRWNPLTGYTSHGLPTDRFMWSDSTGKHKRTREKTKLLSKRWHWETDWMVDYNTPGGVDKDGWQYAIDFPATYHGKKHLTDYVRRRRWVRKARLNTTGPWIELGHTKLLDCSLQVDGDDIVAWAVAANGDVLFRTGVTTNCPAGISWQHISSDQHMISISCGKKQVWAVGKNGTAYWRCGLTPAFSMGRSWETVESPRGSTLKQISIGRDTVWSLDSNGRISVRKEVTSVFPEGTYWQVLSNSVPEHGSQDELGPLITPLTITSGGGFRHVTTGNNVWAITSSGTLAYRIGVDSYYPAGSAWSLGTEGNWLHCSLRS